MADRDTGEERERAAGDFSAWLSGMQRGLRGEGASDVPCHGCTACCTSSQFVPIGPEETGTLAHIPAELLFPAPRMPLGHVVLGYDERGHCPMLIDNRCSIYEHRPRACRTYDCRIFPAAAVDLDDDDKAAIARRVARWRFSYPTGADRVRHAAVAAAARFLDEYAGDGAAAMTTTQRAVVAVEIHETFLGRDETDQPMLVVPDPHAVRVEVTRRIGAGPPANG